MAVWMEQCADERRITRPQRGFEGREPVFGRLPDPPCGLKFKVACVEIIHRRPPQ